MVHTPTKQALWARDFACPDCGSRVRCASGYLELPRGARVALVATHHSGDGIAVALTFARGRFCTLSIELGRNRARVVAPFAPFAAGVGKLGLPRVVSSDDAAAAAVAILHALGYEGLTVQVATMRPDATWSPRAETVTQAV